MNWETSFHMQITGVEKNDDIFRKSGNECIGSVKNVLSINIRFFIEAVSIIKVEPCFFSYGVLCF